MKKLFTAFVALFAFLITMPALAADKAEVHVATDSIVTSQIIDFMVSPPVVKSDLPVVIDLWAPWCGPCRRLAPVVEELAQEYAGRVAFYKVNVDDNPLTAMAFRAQSIPMLVFIPADGKRINAVVGLQPKETLQQVINDYLLAPAK